MNIVHHHNSSTERNIIMNSHRNSSCSDRTPSAASIALKITDEEYDEDHDDQNDNNNNDQSANSALTVKSVDFIRTSASADIEVDLSTTTCNSSRDKDQALILQSKNSNESNTSIHTKGGGGGDNENDIPKHTLTYGRKLSRTLLNFSWYNPKSSRGSKSSSTNSNSSNYNSGGGGVSSFYDRYSSFTQTSFAALQHGTGSLKNSLLRRMSSSSSSISSMFREQSKTTTTTATTIQAPSLEKAWEHFEHESLPRRFVNSRKSRKGKFVRALPTDSPTNNISTNLSPTHSQTDYYPHSIRQRHLLASASLDTTTQQQQANNTNNQETKLYPVCGTPISDMIDFGLGIKLYFQTLIFFGILCLFAGLMNIPSILYFQSPVYDPTYSDPNSKFTEKQILKGTAICNNQHWLPCPTCRPSDFSYFPSTNDRLAFGTSGSGTSDSGTSDSVGNDDTFTFILKNGCKVDETIGRNVLITFLFISISVCSFIYYQRKQIYNYTNAKRSPTIIERKTREIIERSFRRKCLNHSNNNDNDNNNDNNNNNNNDIMGDEEEQVGMGLEDYGRNTIEQGTVDEVEGQLQEPRQKQKNNTIMLEEFMEDDTNDNDDDDENDNEVLDRRGVLRKQGNDIDSDDDNNNDNEKQDRRGVFNYDNDNEKQDRRGVFMRHYTIEIKNPPKHATNPNEWKSFFESKFNNVHVTTCTITKNNKYLIKLLIRRRKALLDLCNSLPALDIDVDGLSSDRFDSRTIIDTDREMVADTERQMPALRRFESETTQETDGRIKKKETYMESLTNDINNLPPVPCWKKLVQLDPKKNLKRIELLNEQIQQLHAPSSKTKQKHGISISKVYVTFESIQDKIHVFDEIKIPKLYLFWLRFQSTRLGQKICGRHSTDFNNYKFDDTFLDIDEPKAEPHQMRWEDSENVSIFIRILQQSLTYIISLSVISLGAVIIFYARKITPFVASMTITILNMSAPKIGQALMLLESHPTTKSYQYSFYIKVITHRWANTAIMALVVTPFTDTLQSGNKFLDWISVLFLIELIQRPLLQIVDIMGNLKRHFFGPRQPDQRRMDFFFQASDYNLGERYTDMTKVILLTFFYSVLFPASFFFTTSVIIVAFWLDKFRLLRTWKQKTIVGTEMVSFSHYFFLLCLLGYAIFASYTYSQFPYDNACETDNLVSESYVGARNLTLHDGSQFPVEVTADQYEYRFCKQFLFRSSPPTFPAIPTFLNDGYEWMTEPQEVYAAVLGWTSLVVLIFVCTIIFVKLFMTFVYPFCFKVRLPHGQSNRKNFYEIDVGAYVPQVIISGYKYPFLLCDMNLYERKSIGWQDPHHSYMVHNITCDFTNCEKSTQESFATVKYWKESSKPVFSNDHLDCYEGSLARNEKNQHYIGNDVVEISANDEAGAATDEKCIFNLELDSCDTSIAIKDKNILCQARNNVTKIPDGDEDNDITTNNEKIISNLDCVEAHKEKLVQRVDGNEYTINNVDAEFDYYLAKIIDSDDDISLGDEEVQDDDLDLSIDEQNFDIDDTENENHSWGHFVDSNEDHVFNGCHSIVKSASDLSIVKEGSVENSVESTEP